MVTQFTTAFLKLTLEVTLKSWSCGATAPFKLQHIVISMTHSLLPHSLRYFSNSHSEVLLLLSKSETNPTNARMTREI